jgi:3',5'-cyclic AMP phosphodiesterase CpdA
MLFGAVSPQQSQKFRFALIGDRTGGAKAGVYEAVWREINVWRPDFAINAGDTIEGDSDAMAELQWRQLRPLFRRFQRTIYFTPGNHDIWSEASRRLYEKETGRPAHYGFNYENAHFTVLNNSGSFNLSAEEMLFLSTDLERNKARTPKFVFFHQPFWLLPLKLQNAAFPFHQLVRKYGVSYVVSAHVHQFSRMERDGIVYMMAGSSGGRLRGHDPVKEFNQGWFYQWLRVNVKGSAIEVIVKELDPPFGQGHAIRGEEWGENGLAR